MEVFGWIVIVLIVGGLFWAAVGDAFGFEQSSLAALWVAGIGMAIIFFWGVHDDGLRRDARYKAQAERRAKGEIVPEESTGHPSGIRPIVIPRRR